MTVLDAPAVPALVVLELTEALPGFPVHRDFALVAADASGVIHWLQSVDPAGPRFLVVDAAAFFPDYAPELPRTTRSELALADGASPVLYCLVTVPDSDVARATANLRAPLVVNASCGLARQVVLTEGDHPIGRPLRR